MPRISPKRESRAEAFVVQWVAGFEQWSDLVKWPDGKEKNLLVDDARPTLLGWYLLLALPVAFVRLSWRRSYGGWVLGATSYLCGMFLCAQVNPRYFGAAWPVLIPLLAFPLDLICSFFWQRFRRPPAREAHLT